MIKRKLEKDDNETWDDYSLLTMPKKLKMN